MRRVIYTVILASLLLVPIKRLDVAKLEPVQTVAIYTEPGAVVLKTDTDNAGRGSTVAEALRDLEETTPGVIYLNTAEYLLVSEDAKEYVDYLRQYLRASVLVSMWDGKGEVAAAAEYLSVKKDLPTLKSWQIE